MNALTEFHRELVAIYGYGVQVSTALMFWHQWLNKQVSSHTRTPDNEMFFGKSDPNDPDAFYVYRRTFGYLLAASKPNGDTSVIHRRNLVTLLYTSWEDRHRGKIAKEAGLEDKNELGSDVFGDVRRYRHAIMHTRGRLRVEPKVFRFFRKGDKVTLTADHMDIIFRTAIGDLNRIGKEYFGTNPRFNFETPMRIQGS